MTFDEWMVANERLMHCGHMNDEERMRMAFEAGAAAEREACAKVCQAVINSGEYDGHQQYAAAACRNEIAMRSNVEVTGLRGSSRSSG